MNNEKDSLNGYKIGLYCRLSKDDEQLGDSASIETQKLFLRNYCEKNYGTDYSFFVDDGYSGVNFNRPAFKKLKAAIEENRINCVITKDLSRLGRDYIMTGYYTEMYFPENGVRYIAINDSVDTISDGNDIAPFKNILNDMYAKDISRKIKTAKRQRSMAGYYTSGQPPYGYVVDPNNKKKLKPDGETAPIVMRIFKAALNGMNYSQIANMLTSENIETPAMAKIRNGDSRFLRNVIENDKRNEWNYNTVKQILQNRMYVGDMVSHKTEVINYKSKKKMSVPKEDYIIVPGTHEPIVERSDYDTVQLMIEERKRKSCKRIDNVFEGIVYCEKCGAKMMLIMKNVRGKEKAMFQCPTYKMRKKGCDLSGYVYYDELYKEITNRIKTHIMHAICCDSSNSLYHRIEVLIEEGVLAKRRHLLGNRIVSEKKAQSGELLSKATTFLSAKMQSDNINIARTTLHQLIDKYENLNLTAKDREWCIAQTGKVIDLATNNIDFNKSIIASLIERINVLNKNENGTIRHELNVYYKYTNILELK